MGCCCGSIHTRGGTKAFAGAADHPSSRVEDRGNQPPRDPVPAIWGRAVHKVGETDPNGRWSPVGPDLTRAIEQSGIRVFSGHMAFGLHEYIPGPCLYVTILRSHRSHRLLLRLGAAAPGIVHRSEALPHIRASTSSLENGQVRALVENGQTRLIGRPLLAWTGPIDRQTLETAKRNLDAFTVAGLVERFDESVDLMQRLLGWPARTTTPTLNVTPERSGTAS